MVALLELRSLHRPPMGELTFSLRPLMAQVQVPKVSAVALGVGGLGVHFFVCPLGAFSHKPLHQVLYGHRYRAVFFTCFQEVAHDK